MKILVTGYKGLIGRKIYNTLNKLGHNVTGFDRGDKLIDQYYDMIIHCAANCIIRDVIRDPSLTKENIDLTFDIMELARRSNCKKVILFSSSRVTHNEDNPYIASKKFLENMARAYKDCYNIDYIIIRPETVWGRNDNPVRVIPHWISCAFDNQAIDIYGDKNKKLSPLYIDDFIIEFMKIFERFDEYKNTEPMIISGKPMLASIIANKIINVINSKSRIIFLKPELTQPQDVTVKINKNEIRLDNKFEERLKEYLLEGEKNEI